MSVTLPKIVRRYRDVNGDLVLVWEKDVLGMVTEHERDFETVACELMKLHDSKAISGSAGIILLQFLRSFCSDHPSLESMFSDFLVRANREWGQDRVAQNSVSRYVAGEK